MDPSNIKPVVFDPKYIIPSDIVDDIICRFLLNIPKEEKFDSIRVCFQIELAHWYFVDYYCGDGCSPVLAQLRNIPYNQFAYIMFQKTPHLRPRLPEIDMHMAAFREYKMRVPTFGAILLNKNLTKVVLVQGFRNHWGFPKGKVNEVEEPVSCAIREVLEETGYDIGNLVNKDHFIESRVLERTDRLYLVRGVDQKYPFQPQTQFEIKNVKWFNINELPEHKKDANPAILKSGVPISNFYSVYPYVKRLKMWVADKLEGRNKIQNFKLRTENESVESQQQMVSTSSSQRNAKKSVNTQPQSKSANNSIPFHLQQFLPSASAMAMGASSVQGWTLFQGENKPYVMNSNAVKELLLSSQNQLKQQQRQTDLFANVTIKPKGSTNKNARRRLFSEEGTKASGKQQQQQHSKPTPSSSKSVTVQKMQISNRNNSGGSHSKNELLNCPSWTNFSFDRERVYKAFFTPPSI